MDNSITFDRFGGLRLDLPLDEVGAEEAIALLDVEPGGKLRHRPGLTKYSSSLTSIYNRLFVHSDTRLLARRGEFLVAISSATKKELASTLAVETTFHMDFARLGTPSASYTYIGTGLNEGAIGRFDGTEFKTPTATVDGVAGKAMPKARYLAVWPEGGNRLVVMGTYGAGLPVGGPGGAASSNSHVWFSEPGNAEEWSTEGSEKYPANYVQLSPGDGESIVGGCYWNGQIFVFKETKMFVFYNVAVEEGNPEFLFRVVQLGTRIREPGANNRPSLIAAPDAVYFVSDDGVWATTGGPPVLLSKELSPLSEPTTVELPEPAAKIFNSCRWLYVKGIQYSGNALYVGLGESSGASAIKRICKFDFILGTWTVYSTNAFDMVSWVAGESSWSHLFISCAQEEVKSIFYFDWTTNEDPVSTLTPIWQSGFYDLGTSDEKTLSETKLWGIGGVTISGRSDFKNEDDTGASTKLEMGKATAQARAGFFQRGTLFSHRLELAAGASVQRVTRYLASTDVPRSESQ
jgi:hypothetical protein